MALDTIPKQEGGKLKAVASGTLPSGQPVVVNSDGTVSVVEESSVTGGAGTPVVFNAGSNTTFASTVFDSSNNKIVIAYMDGSNSNYGTAIVGTVSGSSISFGTEVVFEAANACQHFATAYDTTNNKIVIAYRYLGTQGRAVVGTVSGTSISFGSPTAFSTSEVDNTISAVYDPNEQKVVIAWRDQGNSSYCASIVGTVSGTSISFGTKVIVDSANTLQTALVYDTTNNKVVLAYSPYKTSTYGFWHGYAAVGTVSGTSISWGSTVRFDTNNTGGYDINYLSAVFDPVAEKTVIAYRGNLAYGESRVGTVSGTSISFGAIAVFKSTTVYYTSTVFDPVSNSPTIFYRNQTLQTGEFVKGTVSGTSISFDDSVTFTSNNIDWLSAAVDSNNNKFVTSYRDSSNSGYGTSVVSNNAFNSTNLTSENYIGMSGGAVSVDSQTEEIGSAVVFNNTGNTTKPHLCFDTNSNKVVIGFVDNAASEKGTAIVGTVSGTSISFGSETVYEQSVTDFPAMVYDSSNNKVIVAYQDEGNTDYGTVAVGTVSGTSISFGTPVVFESAAVQHVALAFDSNSNKVVISYSDQGNSEYGTAIVGTVSGTSISFGSPAVFESSQTARINSTFDSNSNKVVIAYRTTTGKAAVGTVSGTSISFGTPVEFYNATTEELDIVFDSNVNKVVIAYQSSASDAGLAKVGAVSGTSISFGAEVTFESANVASISPVFDSSINKVVLVYSDVGNSRYGTYVVGTISGTDITFGTPSVFASVDTRSQIGAVFDTNSNKVAIAYRDDSNSSYGTSVVLQAGYTNITRGSVADGDNATVDIVGTVSSNQVSLTAGQQYYVQTDGTIGTTPASPSVLAGTAVSATKMVVKS